jgi:hypothetical protein
VRQIRPKVAGPGLSDLLSHTHIIRLFCSPSNSEKRHDVHGDVSARHVQRRVCVPVGPAVRDKPHEKTTGQTRRAKPKSVRTRTPEDDDRETFLRYIIGREWIAFLYQLSIYPLSLNDYLRVIGQFERRIGKTSPTCTCQCTQRLVNGLRTWPTRT